jgi:hypothetical protein
MATRIRNEEWKSELGQSQNEIRWLVPANPKRSGFKAYDRFDRYFGAETVDEYLKAGGTKGDLRYDWEHQFLDIVSDSPPAEAQPDVPPAEAQPDETPDVPPAEAQPDAAPDSNMGKAVRKGSRGKSAAKVAEELLS